MQCTSQCQVDSYVHHPFYHFIMKCKELSLTLIGVNYSAIPVLKLNHNTSWMFTFYHFITLWQKDDDNHL